MFGPAMTSYHHFTVAFGVHCNPAFFVRLGNPPFDLSWELTSQMDHLNEFLKNKCPRE